MLSNMIDQWFHDVLSQKPEEKKIPQVPQSMISGLPQDKLREIIRNHTPNTPEELEEAEIKRILDEIWGDSGGGGGGGGVGSNSGAAGPGTSIYLQPEWKENVISAIKSELMMAEAFNVVGPSRQSHSQQTSSAIPALPHVQQQPQNNLSCHHPRSSTTHIPPLTPMSAVSISASSLPQATWSQIPIPSRCAPLGTPSHPPPPYPHQYHQFNQPMNPYNNQLPSRTSSFPPYSANNDRNGNSNWAHHYPIHHGYRYRPMAPPPPYHQNHHRHHSHLSHHQRPPQIVEEVDGGGGGGVSPLLNQPNSLFNRISQLPPPLRPLPPPPQYSPRNLETPSPPPCQEPTDQDMGEDGVNDDYQEAKGSLLKRLLQE